MSVISHIEQVKIFLLDLQNRICSFLEQEGEGEVFKEDAWEQPLGYGFTRHLSEGAVIEKAGVNFSHVKGATLPKAATLKRADLQDASFHALGISVILHPYNPYVPTVHMNVRFIEVKKNNGAIIWWFGGGLDLTPYYGFTEDCRHWHRILKETCSPYGQDVYPRYKKWCDDYFYLKHRNEQRGIGGLFFDDLNEWGFARSFDFMQAVGNAFIEAYRPILKKRKVHPFTQKERAFQAYRRGRYVEFNLLYDRGTLFGLESKGRVESILISLPPLVHFKYDWAPGADTEEKRLYEEFLVVREWI